MPESEIRNPRSQMGQGFVLVCVLWAMAVLTVIALGFAHRAVLDRRAAAFSVDRVQARYLARGSAERGIAELENRLFAWRMLRREGVAFPLSQWPKSRDLLTQARLFDLGGGDYTGDVCNFEVEDAESRISLNAAPGEVLEELDALGFRAVSKIMERRANQAVGKPAEPFVALEEVRLLEGVTYAAWNGQGDTAGLKDVLTVWGDGKTNLNTASEAVLRCLPELDEGVISAIVAYRKGPDGVGGTGDDRSFTKVRLVSRDLGLTPDLVEPLIKYCKTESEFYTITGFATQRQGKVRAACTAVVRTRGGGAGVLEWRESSGES